MGGATGFVAAQAAATRTAGGIVLSVIGLAIIASVVSDANITAGGQIASFTGDLRLRPGIRPTLL